MIAESDLLALSHPGAPKMVTEVPGPKVSALMAESAKYESFTRGGGGFPVILEQGKGSTVFDADGNLYIDMAAGVAVNAVGRGHPKVLEAIRRQCDVIMHTTDITNPKRIELAKKVSGIMPEGLAGNCHTSCLSRPAATRSRRPSSSPARTPAARRSSPSTAPITGSGAAPRRSPRPTTTVTAGAR